MYGNYKLVGIIGLAVVKVKYLSKMVDFFCE